MVLKSIHPLELNGLCRTDSSNKQQKVTPVTEDPMQQQQQLLREQSPGWLMEVSGITAPWHEPEYLTMILWRVHFSLR